MMHRASLFAGLACALLGAACASDDTSFYKRALENDSVPAGAGTGANGEGAFPYEFADLAPAHRPDPKSDEAGIWYQMEKAERRIKTAGQRYRNAEVNAYLSSVTCRVAGAYCKDIRVYTMRAPGLGAGMYPNGMMHISTGLLLRVRNEAQLAAVIGHETGHYLRKHSLQRLRDMITKTNSLFFFNFVLLAAGLPVAGDLAAIIALGDIKAYGRNHEREADGYGLLLMARAGYDPEEAWKIWDRAVKEMKATEGFEDRSLFLASHPQPGERMVALRRLAKRVKTDKAAELGRARFRRIIAPIRAQLIRDELNRRQLGAFEVLIDQLIEDGDNLAELYFFKGEMHRLRGAKGDFEKAVGFYARAEKEEGTPPPGLKRSAGLVLLKLGRKAAAGASFSAYLEKNPRAKDAGVIRRLIESTGP